MCTVSPNPQIATSGVKVSRRQSKSINDKEYQRSKRLKPAFKFPTMLMRLRKISSENRVTQDINFHTATTTLKGSYATFYKKRLKLNNIPTSKKPFDIFEIYRTFEIEYSQETTTTDHKIDILYLI